MQPKVNAMKELPINNGKAVAVVIYAEEYDRINSDKTKI